MEEPIKISISDTIFIMKLINAWPDILLLTLILLFLIIVSDFTDNISMQTSNPCPCQSLRLEGRGKS